MRGCVMQASRSISRRRLVLQLQPGDPRNIECGLPDFAFVDTAKRIHTVHYGKVIPA